MYAIRSYYAFYGREQGHQGITWKIDMPDRFFRLIENLAKNQCDGLKLVQ